MAKKQVDTIDIDDDLQYFAKLAAEPTDYNAELKTASARLVNAYTSMAEEHLRNGNLTMAMHLIKTASKVKNLYANSGMPIVKIR